MASQPIVLGKKVIVPYVATHWAVKVGGTWYEVPGSKSANSPNHIERDDRNRTAAPSGATPLGGGLLGRTTKSQAQINEFIREWERKNPMYKFTTTNCQKFVKDFVDFLGDGRLQVPMMMEAGMRNRGQGPTAYSAHDSEAALARATTGRQEGQHGLARGAAEGPSACAHAVCGTQGFGAFADASLGRAEAAVAGFGVHVDPNINTGLGVRHGNFEASLLGTGFKAGVDGLEVNVAGVGGKVPCSIM